MVVLSPVQVILKLDQVLKEEVLIMLSDASFPKSNV
jgi:hypothetical protein